MRNASDIFCLKEDGTDGMQMFSVNGSCPMKIRRRTQPRENDCFEYGRQMNLEETLARGDNITEKSESDQKRMFDETSAAEASQMIGDSLNLDVPSKSDEKKDSEVQFHKLDQAAGSKEKVTSSTIMRNPLTGAGMEIKEHRKPKKGSKSLNDKWVW